MKSSEISESASTLTFRDGLTDAEKDLARASVSAMIENARAKTRRDNDATQPAVTGLLEYGAGEDGVSTYVLAVPPPFDFGWAWHTGQAPYRVTTDQTTGRLILQARLGEGGATYSQIHAGFGIFLRTDRPARKRGAGRKRALIRWQTQASGVSTFAMCEGGMEFTVLENGVFRGAEARSKLWRKRVAVDEEAGFDGQMTDYWDPRILDFSMEPGRDYTFNVGFWITCDRSFGPLGFFAAQCQGLMEGYVDGMSVVDV